LVLEISISETALVLFNQKTSKIGKTAVYRKMIEMNTAKLFKVKKL
jgi:hypothetical protein